MTIANLQLIMHLNFCNWQYMFVACKLMAIKPHKKGSAVEGLSDQYVFVSKYVGI
jgi:hypothetical protein